MNGRTFAWTTRRGFNRLFQTAKIAAEESKLEIFDEVHLCKKENTNAVVMSAPRLRFS